MLDLIKDLWDFMRERKKFWLAPIILVMLLLGALIVLFLNSAAATEIYTRTHTLSLRGALPI